MTKLTKSIIAVGILWAAYVAYAYFTAYRSAKPFEHYLEGDCPQMNIHVIPSKLNYATVSRTEYVELIAWYDKKAGTEIHITDTSYRRYQSTQNCTKQKVFALLKRESARAGLLQPELRIKYSYMFAIMLLPLVLLLFVVALPAEVLRRRRLE